ncbi:AAA family ATPase [candidate division WOR-3 bacterium]|nr:AAA family ATPase [candidate division WOR-3 bacterium]
MQKSEVRTRKSEVKSRKSKVATNPSVQDYVAQMLKPALYGRGVKQVRMLQTHTSWVFLTGTRAYKVKKPVNFGFLDYTTLAARKFFCNEEFRLNQILSPDIYIRVRPITVSGGRLVLGGRGQVIDYCLEMKELPQEWIMTEQLKRGHVTHEHVDSIARSIADFHKQADHGRDVAQYGSIKTIRFNWDENFAQTTDFIGKTTTRRQFEETKSVVEKFMAGNRGLFQRRRAGGFVRRCHGDLHSRNIFVLPSEGPESRVQCPESARSDVRIFDCIEFNPRFSCSDVASEIAFMAMDLDYWGRKDLADFFVERYVAYTGDEGLPCLLNFYKCYRAYVRGKVTSFVLNDPGVGRAEKGKAAKTANEYFRLSHHYAAAISTEPKLVVMIGLPGVGKTYVARRLAERIGAFHFLSDSIRKQLLGIPLGRHQTEAYGSGIYKGNIGARTYAELLRRARVFLSSGFSVVADATFLSGDSRRHAYEAAAKAGAPVLFVFADCPERTVRSRLRRRAGEYSFSDATVDIYRAMKNRYFKPQASSFKSQTRESCLRQEACGFVEIDTSQPMGMSLAKIERALLRI